MAIEVWHFEVGEIITLNHATKKFSMAYGNKLSVLQIIDLIIFYHTSHNNKLSVMN